MQSNDKSTHLKPWLSSLIRLVLLVALCCVVYQVQLKWLNFSKLHLESPVFLGFALLFVPLNIGLEWLRFKKSMEVSISTKEELWNAFLQGTVVSFFTPAIFAATFGRMRFNCTEKNAAFVFSGLYCGLTQFAVTLGFAGLSTCILVMELPVNSVWIFCSVSILSLAALFVNPKFLFKFFRRFDFSFELSAQQKVTMLGLSAVRYIVFSLQFHSLLQAFGQDFSVHQAWVLMLSYGLITLSPSILFGKIVVREALAVAVFSFFLYPKEPVFIAAFLTWLFNVVLPLIFAALRMLFRWKSYYS